MNCEKIVRKNLKDLKKGRPMRFSKEEHTNAEEFDAYEARCWNRDLPNAEQYTQEELKALMVSEKLSEIKQK